MANPGRSRPTHKSLFLAVLCAFPAWAVAQAAPTTPVIVGEVTLRPVTVTSTRDERTDDEVPNSVSVITDEEKERKLATDIKDLVRYEPGVSVRSNPTRFSAALSGVGRDGNSGFTIRGIEGNQVLMQSDGVRLPLGFAFGPVNFGRGDYLDLDAYKSIEILRGPASTLYGSDGLAGAVSFITKDPSDFLAKGRDFYMALKGAYASADEGKAGTITAAGRMGAFEGLVVFTGRRASETENMGTNEAQNSTRTAPNPQENSARNLLVKGVFQPNARHLVRVTGEQNDHESRTEVFSARSVPPLVATSVLDLDADDDSLRNRISADYEYSSGQAAGKGGIDRAKLTIYRQVATSKERTGEDRNTAVDRRRDNFYQEGTTGGSAALHSSFLTGNVLHRLVYGGDYSRTLVRGLRDGVTPPAGEFLPQKPFPDTEYTLYGAFVQDEILVGESLSLIPALRWDGFKLDPTKDDPQYPALGGPPVDLDGNKALPKLGAVWRFHRIVSAFAQYAQGYRAPTPAQVNQGFENQIANYRSIGNPDLKPESNRTFEAGLRGRSESYSWDVVGFDGRYRDFIAQVQVAGEFTPASPAIFQNVNLSRVRISGFEAKGRLVVAKGWSLIGNFAYAKGDDETANQPLQSVDPPKLVLGAEYAQARWGIQAYATFVRAKDPSRIPPAPAAGPGPAPAFFASPSVRLLDFYAWWRVAQRLTLNIALLNATDSKYWLWSDVRGQLASSTTLDAYTQPGRNFAASLKWEF